MEARRPAFVYCLHIGKREVVTIVESTGSNRIFPATPSDIRLCECCECLDPPLQ